MEDPRLRLVWIITCIIIVHLISCKDLQFLCSHPIVFALDSGLVFGPVITF